MYVPCTRYIVHIVPLSDGSSGYGVPVGRHRIDELH